MDKVDPMEIMLSDIFDKVFYSREKKPDYCWDCDGEGIIELEVSSSQRQPRRRGHRCQTNGM